MKYQSGLLLSWMGICVCWCPSFVWANKLTGSLPVHQVSDTAADAKIKAVNSANRQILLNVLSKYSDVDALKELVNNTSDKDLLNFIDSSSVSNEQISATAYSAKITVNFDNVSVKNWLTQNNVQNWVPFAESAEKFVLSFKLQNGISDWAEIKRIARESDIELDTQSIAGNNVVAKMPVSGRTKFTIAVRDAGWKYSDKDGVLQVWK